MLTTLFKRFPVAAYKSATWTGYYGMKENRLRSGSNTIKKTPKLHRFLRCLRIGPNRRQDQVPGPELVGNEDPPTSIPRRRSHKKTRRFHVQVTQPTRDNDRKQTRFKKPKYRTKNQTVHQTGRVSDFHRNADNRPIT